MLARFQRRLGHEKMGIIRGADMHRVDGRIAHHVLPVARAVQNIIAFGGGVRLAGTGVGHFHHVHMLDAAQRFQMHPAHEAGADHRSANAFHHTHQAAAGFSRMMTWASSAAALVRPSSGDIRLSSCSMDRTSS